MKKVNRVVLIALVLLVVALLLPMGTKEGYRGIGDRMKRMQEKQRRRSQQRKMERQQRKMERRRRDAARAREARFRAMQRNEREPRGA